jgi:hypothetical protein
MKRTARPDFLTYVWPLLTKSQRYVISIKIVRGSMRNKIQKLRPVDMVLPAAGLQILLLITAAFLPADLALKILLIGCFCIVAVALIPSLFQTGQGVSKI